MLHVSYESHPKHQPNVFNVSLNHSHLRGMAILMNTPATIVFVTQYMHIYCFSFVLFFSFFLFFFFSQVLYIKNNQTLSEELGLRPSPT